MRKILPLLLSASTLVAGPFGTDSGAPSFTGLGAASLQESQENTQPRLRVLLRNDRTERPVTDELRASFSPELQRRVAFLFEDEGILELADRVLEAAPGAGPGEVILAPQDTGSSHHLRGRVVLARDTLFQMNRPGEEPTPRQVQRADQGFRNTAAHELGHTLQYRLYGGWLPEVDYASREFMAVQDNSHWTGKETSQTSAWCEGFAEAVAAVFAEDERISRFAFRRVVIMGIKKPRPPHRLDNVEGFVANALYDFWGGDRGSRQFQNTLETLDLESQATRRTERHNSIGEYLREHLARFPEDHLRWELALRANSMLQEPTWIYSSDLSGEQTQDQATLEAGLEKISASLGADRTAKAISGLLQEGGPLPPVQQLLRDLVLRVRAQIQSGEPVFEAGIAGGDDPETMPFEDLAKLVSNAQAAEKALFQRYGYDFHPQVKEAKALREKLEGIYRRRGGR